MTVAAGSYLPSCCLSITEFDSRRESELWVCVGMLFIQKMWEGSIRRKLMCIKEEEELTSKPHESCVKRLFMSKWDILWVFPYKFESHLEFDLNFPGWLFSFSLSLILTFVNINSSVKLKLKFFIFAFFLEVTRKSFQNDKYLILIGIDGILDEV